MKPRAYQEIYDYVFRNKANVEEAIRNTPEQFKSQKRIAKINQIKEFFFDEKNPLIPIHNRKKFRAALRNLKNENLETILYDNITHQIETDEEKLPNLELEFKNLEDKHLFFSEAEYRTAFNNFKNYFYFTQLIANCVESNNSLDNHVAVIHAYKLAVLFGDEPDPARILTSFDLFLKTHNLSSGPKPLHDALVYDLSANTENKKINLATWRALIQVSGTKSLRLFERAFEIEDKLGTPPKNYEEARECARSIIYKLADEDPELADLCVHYDVKEETFNRCLDLKGQRKIDDLLPKIHIDGSELGFSGYHLVKLPIKDPRAFILGMITNCCQSIGGESEQCVIDGLELCSNGFYVMLKENKKKKMAAVETKENDAGMEPINVDGTINYDLYDIVGQGYAWLSQRNNLVIDSWENLRPEADNIVAVAMIKKMGEVIAHQTNTIICVAIGEGGKTPKEFKELYPRTEIMREGTQYGDSTRQKIVYINREFQNQKARDFNKKMNEIRAESKLFDGATQWLRPGSIISQQYIAKCEKMFKNLVFQAYLKNENHLAELWEVLRIEYLQEEIEGSLRESFWELTSIKNLDEYEIDRFVKNRLHFDGSFIAFATYAEKAAKNGNISALKALFEKPFPVDTLKETILMAILATKEFKKEIVEFLIDNQFPLELKDEKGFSLLEYAVRENNIEIVNMLLPFIVTANLLNTLNSSLHLAAKEGCTVIAKILLEAKADVNAKNEESCTPLFLAKDAETVKLLLAANANINAKDFSNRSPIHSIMNFSTVDPSALKAIIEAKADVNVRDKTGYAPIHNIYSSEKTKILVEAKADIDSKADNGTTPLLVSSMLHDSYDTFLFLIEAKAKLNLKNHYGQAAIHYAAQKKHEDWITPLVEKKADINTITEQRETPLQIAVKHSNLSAIKILLDAGANKNDHKAFNIAFHDGNIKICALLKSKNFTSAHINWFHQQMEKILNVKTSPAEEKNQAQIRNILLRFNRIDESNLYHVIYDLQQELTKFKKQDRDSHRFFSNDTLSIGAMIYMLLDKINKEIVYFPLEENSNAEFYKEALGEFFDPLPKKSEYKPFPPS